ncbi:hypothetical protein [Mesorhizobium cantuariense]|uniref:Uncharacterized protein n=1 Tax=Mesorhizobium cantuariense TaxID=1300275 RepID=A0ABV7MH35_9HYPH
MSGTCQSGGRAGLWSSTRLPITTSPAAAIRIRVDQGSEFEEAMAEKSALADYLIKTTGLTLSPEKTKDR